MRKRVLGIALIGTAILVTIVYSYARYKECRENGLSQAYCLAEN